MRWGEGTVCVGFAGPQVSVGRRLPRRPHDLRAEIVGDGGSQISSESQSPSSLQLSPSSQSSS